MTWRSKPAACIPVGSRPWAASTLIRPTNRSSTHGAISRECCPGQLRTLARVAAQFPGLKMIVDHLALIRGKKDAAAFVDLPDLLALARYPNVAAKASALPRFSSEPYPYRNVHTHLRQVFDAFGPKRTFWGTDLTGLPCTYRQAVTMFTEELPWLSDADKEWVMGRGISEFVGWA
jgi:predicted TIM-barrel fold metal-dependent hydrolase